MNIKEKVEEILTNQLEDSVILEIYKTGSQLFSDTPKDLDYVVICDNFKQRIRKVIVKDGEESYDIMLYDREAMLKQLDFSNTDYVRKQLKLYNYFICFRDKVYGDSNIDWNMLDHKEEYLDFLRYEYHKTQALKRDVTRHSKGYVHYYIILKIYDNNKIEITNQMLEDIITLYNGGEQVRAIVE